jgi:hypothetical protein
MTGEADLWRLYRREWIVVYGVAASPAGLEQCRRVYDERYLGRVRDDEVRYVTEGAGPHRVDQLQLLLPNLKGEFKHADDATAFARRQGWEDTVLVGRNGAADHEIRAYGVRLLANG